MNPAKAARLAKERNPEMYCRKCLWRTGGGLCPRHGAELESQRAASIDAAFAVAAIAAVAARKMEDMRKLAEAK